MSGRPFEHSATVDVFGVGAKVKVIRRENGVYAGHLYGVITDITPKGLRDVQCSEGRAVRIKVTDLMPDHPTHHRQRRDQ